MNILSRFFRPRPVVPSPDLMSGAIAAAAPASTPAPSLIKPAVADFSPMFWAGRRMTPDQVRQVLQSAMGGNIQEQWQLFDLMEETWPRLTKNLNEIRRAAARVTYSVKPYCEGEDDVSDSAQERADVVEASLLNWRPRPGTFELSLEDSLYNSLDALGKGLSVLEITWQRLEQGLLPRCAHFVHPTKYGWNADGTELGLVADVNGVYGGRSQSWQAFPPGQFWVGTWHSRSGAPGQTALLRSLAPYWCGITFGWEWLLNNAQIFGVPFRWATYDPNQPNLLPTISSMLANLGSAGWAAFPAGTTLEFKEATQRAGDNPQVFIQELANKYCDQLILGQEASSESKPAGLGNGASNLHGSVRADRLQDAAQWCADLLNYQLVLPLLRWNWGDETEPPTIVPEIAAESDPQAKADRDKTLAEIAPLPRKWFYERHAIPEPEEGEETVGGVANPSQANPGSSETAPGMPSADGTPVTAPESDQLNLKPGSENGGDNPQKGAKPAKSNSPETAAPSSDALKASNAGKPPTLPGEYRTPVATQHRLAIARAADFAPLRKVAEPILQAIEAGNLEVVGELEAFIAHLDALAPTVAGAGELANTLHASLAEAAIQGAAGTYSKLNDKKS